MKQHVNDPAVVVQLHILEIVNLIEHQEINNLLKVSTYYNTDLIRVFYVGLESRKACTFHFKIGKSSYHFLEATWREVFGISMFSHNANFSDHALHPNFDRKSHLNSCLKAPSSDDSFDKLSTGSLKRDPRILQWIITHVSRPRKGGHSLIDQAEVHLMDILQNKFKIYWPNYFVLRMFVLEIIIEGLPCVTLRRLQRFLSIFILVCRIFNASLSVGLKMLTRELYQTWGTIGMILPRLIFMQEGG